MEEKREEQESNSQEVVLTGRLAAGTLRVTGTLTVIPAAKAENEEEKEKE